VDVQQLTADQLQRAAQADGYDVRRSLLADGTIVLHMPDGPVLVRRDGSQEPAPRLPQAA
jgi:hypothetical protein